MTNTVCDSCCDYAYDQGIEDYDAQVSTMLQAGDVVDPHQCDHVVEPEILCDCGCRGKSSLGEIATGYINELTEVGEEGVRERLKDAVQVMLAKKRTSFEDRGK